jgi:hypothetical protein
MGLDHRRSYSRISWPKPRVVLWPPRLTTHKPVHDLAAVLPICQAGGGRDIPPGARHPRPGRRGTRRLCRSGANPGVPLRRELYDAVLGRAHGADGGPPWHCLLWFLCTGADSPPIRGS